jgi:hypothetical protein
MSFRILLLSVLLLPTFTQLSCQNRPTQSSPASASNQRPIILFTAWSDPNEGGFSLNVPEGWQVSGATTRTSDLDPHQVLRASSPDGAMQILLGDPNLIPRVGPSPLLEYGGIHEGQTIPSDAAGRLLVASYQNGEQFAESYIQDILCPRAQITSSATLQDASRKLYEQALGYGRATGAAAVEAWVGEASFSCDRQSGYVRASTVSGTSPNGAQVWAVLELSGFIVKQPADAPMAHYVLNNIVSSLHIDPQWQQRQARRSADVTGAVLHAQQQMAASIADHAREQTRNNQIDVMAGWEARNRTISGVMQRGSDARRGTTTADDPVQGSRTVSNAYQSTWTRPDGSIVQTDSTTPPDNNSDWRLMQTH